MNIGSLRHRITIEHKTVDNSGLDPVETWSTFATVWAAIEPLKGTERWIDGAKLISSDVTGRIRIRYLKGVTSEMRVKFGSRVYEILAVINVNERCEEMSLMVKELIA